MAADPRTYYFQLPAQGRPQPFRLDEQLIPDFRWFNANRTKSRNRNPITGITTVVIHATAGWATQHAIDTWKRGPASAHWIVPDEDEPQHGRFAWAVCSEALAANHVKNSLVCPDLGPSSRINEFSLGVEIVNTQNVTQYRDPYSDWQVAMAAQIVRYAWAKYPNLRHVISHARVDPANRADPGRNFPWAAFEAAVKSAANDPVAAELARSIRPVSDFPELAGQGACCP